MTGKKIILSIMMVALIVLAMMPMSAGTVYAIDPDNTSPEINLSTLSVSLPEDKNVVTAGDKVGFSVEVTDNVGADYVDLIIASKENNKERVFTLSYNENSGKWEGEYTVTENDPSGAWCIARIYTYDENNNSAVVLNSTYYTSGGEGTVLEDLSAYNFTVSKNSKITFNTNGGSSIAPQYVILGEKATAPENPTKEGLTFERWYSDEALTQVFDFNSAVNEDITLYAGWAEFITAVDIGNIWTKLDSVNVVPFTAEVHDESDTDGANYNDKMEITDEQWSASGAPAISKSSSGIPVVGKTYSYAITLHAKKGYVFNTATIGALPFKLIVGGTEVVITEHMVSAVVRDNGKTVTIIFSSAPIAPVTINALDLSGAAVTGISNKTYTGKALTQNLTVKMNVNGTAITLKSGTDYTISYENNTNAGKNATVIITGKGKYTKSVSKTFTINKAANPLKITPKTATVKHKKLKKKTQTLAVTKVINFTKDAKDKKTYALSSAKKGKKSFKKYFRIDKTTGKLTIKKNKKMKKGTYKVKIKAKAAGNGNYKASAWKSVTFKVRVK